MGAIPQYTIVTALDSTLNSDALARGTGKAPGTFESHFLFGQVSSSAQVTMQSQNRKRAPAWTEREVLDLIAVWGEESVLSELRSKRRNAKTFQKISEAMRDRGYIQDASQCQVKLEELRQAYQKTKESNRHSGTEPQTCRFYSKLHAILGGAATITPPLSVDSEYGILSTIAEDFADGEDEENDKLGESTQHTVLPDSQDLFITLTEIPSQPNEAGEETSAANVSSLSPPSQRLSQIRRRKKCTRDDMFSELMQSSGTDRAVWRDTIPEYRTVADECEGEEAAGRSEEA
ncbi:zinc finger and SCAN domain-containing protein 29-like isoform X2 [Lepidochelys kempii]|uniref:zinc finger and SCAN domain-containing protein 29-like isoform X2 n=1 Tax=Lepidochelys kempii TaxID=8472 RepID=UPI003C6ED206